MTRWGAHWTRQSPPCMLACSVRHITRPAAVEAKPHVRSLSSLCAAAQDPKQATRDRIAALKAAGELNDGAARDLGAIPPVPRAPGGAAAPKPGRAAAPEVLHPRRCLPRASLLRVS